MKINKKKTKPIFKQTNYLRRFKPDEKKHSESGIARILSDDLIHFYNWKGTAEKKPLYNLVLFKKTCFGK